MAERSPPNGGSKKPRRHQVLHVGAGLTVTFDRTQRLLTFSWNDAGIDVSLLTSGVIASEFDALRGFLRFGTKMVVRLRCPPEEAGELLELLGNSANVTRGPLERGADP